MCWEASIPRKLSFSPSKFDYSGLELMMFQPTLSYLSSLRAKFGEPQKNIQRLRGMHKETRDKVADTLTGSVRKSQTLSQASLVAR